MRNFFSPFSSSSRTFCLSSWRFPTINCPSTSTTTTSPCLLIAKLMRVSELVLNRPGRRLKRRNRRDVNNVLRLRAAREIGSWPGETLEYRTDRARASQSLDELISDVAGVEIWKHEHVSIASDRASRGFPGRDRWYQRGITLQFSVHAESGLAGTYETQSL